VPVPILKQGDCLIASVQSALSDAEMLALRDDLARQVRQHRARGVVVDVTALDVIDSFAALTLRTIAEIMRLSGAQTVIVGIHPDAAFAMVQLGLTLDGVPTALDLDAGLAFLARPRLGAGRRDAP